MQQPSKINGSAKSVVGSVKENLGHITGNKSMEGKGMQDRVEGDTEVKAAKAQGYAEGVVDNVSGVMKNAAGNVLGNEKLKTEGVAEQKKGDAKKEMNK